MLTGIDFCESIDARNESGAPSAPASLRYMKPKRRRRRGAVGQLRAELNVL